MTRVLVTGAAGFIGSHLVEALDDAGHDVIAVDSFDPMYPRADKERNLAEIGPRRRVTFHELDVRDGAAVGRVLTKDTVVVHLAGRAGVRPSLADPVGYAEANVTATAALAAAAKAAGVSRFVFGSSSSVYGDDTAAPFREDAVAVRPVSPYAATKRACELLLGSLAPVWGLRVASLRFFTVIGPRQRPDLAIHAFARRLVRNEPIVLFGDGTESRDYTYCGDIVAGVMAAIAWTESAPVGVEPFNLGGNQPVPLRQMVDMLVEALGVTPRLEWAPRQAGDVQHTWADLTKSGARLGYAPRTSFAEGLERFVHWFRRTHARTD